MCISKIIKEYQKVKNTYENYIKDNQKQVESIKKVYEDDKVMENFYNMKLIVEEFEKKQDHLQKYLIENKYSLIPDTSKNNRLKPLQQHLINKNPKHKKLIEKADERFFKIELDEIGKGAYGEVCTITISGKKYALKMIDVNESFVLIQYTTGLSNRNQLYEQLEKEFKILSELDHPNIIKLFYFQYYTMPYTDKNYLILFMEYHERDLFEEICLKWNINVINTNSDISHLNSQQKKILNFFEIFEKKVLNFF